MKIIDTSDDFNDILEDFKESRELVRQKYIYVFICLNNKLFEQFLGTIKCFKGKNLFTNGFLCGCT